VYIHELSDWPDFHCSNENLLQQVSSVRLKQGKLLGQMESLGFRAQKEAILQTITTDVVKTSEIEGEFLDPVQVRSSVAKRLGIDIGGLGTSDRNVDGIVEMMMDVAHNYNKPLTRARLFRWHKDLFPNAQKRLVKIRVGTWRDDREAPMRVVSGPYGRERVHFQAPAAERVDREMHAFITWFESQQATDPLIKAGLAHLWFVTIHPFSDGNGRIARAIADMALARSDRTDQRFYSMSAQIKTEQQSYYEVLERTQRASMDVTTWLQWFLSCLERAVDGAQDNLQRVLTKAHYWQSWGGLEINERQKKILNRLLDGTFNGKLNSSKWAKINKTSPDTALRDIKQLLDHGVLIREPGGGRSTKYALSELRRGDRR
jgi:Fic family protein